MHARNICMLEIYIHDVSMKSRNFCEICEFRSNSRMFILTKVFQILQNFFFFFSAFSPKEDGKRLLLIQFVSTWVTYHQLIFLMTWILCCNLQYSLWPRSTNCNLETWMKFKWHIQIPLKMSQMKTIWNGKFQNKKKELCIYSTSDSCKFPFLKKVED